jgi:hypothetical protein
MLGIEKKPITKTLAITAAGIHGWRAVSESFGTNRERGAGLRGGAGRGISDFVERGIVLALYPEITRRAWTILTFQGKVHIYEA